MVGISSVGGLQITGEIADGIIIDINSIRIGKQKP
jgi:hypothetical protein